MFTINNEKCIDCRLCITECPDRGISIEYGPKGEFGNDSTYNIDANKCTECIEFNRESKCAYICPVDCILLTNPEADDVLWAKHKKNKQNL